MTRNEIEGSVHKCLDYETGAIGQGFGFFDNGWFYKTPGVAVIHGKGLSCSGKRVLGQELAELIWRTLI